VILRELYKKWILKRKSGLEWNLKQIGRGREKPRWKKGVKLEGLWRKGKEK